jgi:PIN domain nuclease of toxin-antitoxin system
MNVFDSSALLAFLQGESGAAHVREYLQGGGICSAANWSEVAQKTVSSRRNWQKARLLLVAFGLAVEPVTMADAEAAAALWRTGDPLSLADRLCLALGSRLSADIITCDKQWAGRPRVVLAR